MAMAPRIGVLSLLLVAATFSPTASASGCLDLEYTNFGEGLHVLANTGRELAFGIVAGYPGEGVGAVVIITPALCTGVGLSLGAQDATAAAQPTVDETLRLLPLP